jgi:hypothetical protein
MLENDQSIDMADTSINDLLNTLRGQGITTLEDLVEKTLGSVDEALSAREDDDSGGCCFICSPTGHGYVYVILHEKEQSASAS